MVFGNRNESKGQKDLKVFDSSDSGAGAFNRFNNCIHHYGIADDWYWYRFNAMKRIVIDWCKANNIEHEDQ